MIRAVVGAEAWKLVTLRAFPVAFGVGVLVPLALLLINRAAGGEGVLAFAGLPGGAVGAVVLGVVVISGEYGNGQITTTLAAVPRRWVLLLGKAFVVVVAVGVLAAVAVGVVVGVEGSWGADGVLGRALGTVVYWVLTALMAFAVAVVARSGLVPVVVFAVNGTVVSASYLLLRVTPLAMYLPDVAGVRMFAGADFHGEALPPVTGGLVMAGWAAAAVVAAGVVFARRDV
ncbi:ABC transporter permease [Actinosynnema pretiosum subsp. pretiosum]|uniref:ABC transporter permease n=1 Tax=Actinosynnema pretiosum subsp. pretiosum TaxID=103721 RepID=A0AA45L9T5_9PSEU|nr:integral membrane protein [Actinosynnema pretiosum subsp. pretiosum]QUF05992.1 ABC transporter permease [Actinosynnema pretiosum subsp. pretiosum]